MTRCLRVLLFVALAMPPLSSNMVVAQDDEANSGALIDFARDVQPILEKRCLQCHGPEEAKNDFRIDEWESVESYVEAGDLESSSMWADYLITDDPDMLMPPATDAGPGGLHGGELAVVKLWIEEGAQFEWLIQESDSPTPPPVEPIVNASVPQKLWTFQGLFHPASVHFPIALLMVSGLFTFLSFFHRTSFEPVAFHCLWIGALGAVAASVMGWSYAVHEGYGTGYSLDIAESAIDRHRWLGIAVAVLSLLLIPVARGVCNTGSTSKRVVWFLGAVLVALGVSVTGYQGGELTYGEDHYMKEFERLFPSESPVGEDVTAVTPDRSNAPDAEEPADSEATNSVEVSEETKQAPAIEQEPDAQPDEPPGVTEETPTQEAVEADNPLRSAKEDSDT